MTKLVDHFTYVSTPACKVRFSRSFMFTGYSLPIGLQPCST